ncbi:MAG: hypothetical protein MI924_16345 [Chloroflexales bacterium]|nr:hypothetical protein [Chloroflexales bacterium]
MDTVIDFTPTSAPAPIDVHVGHTPLKYRPYTQRHLDEIPQIRQLRAEDRLAMKAVAAVLPFRTNAYVVEELIDWTTVPDDPIFRLVFPQPGMLAPSDLDTMMDLLRCNASVAEIEQAAHAIRMRLNPHPAGQMDLNVPWLQGRPLHGLQHKYAETVLFFPSHGQTCHAYCTYCFRWAQFIGDPDLKMVSRESEALQNYLLEHPEVTDVLITGGDPMIMKAEHLARYIEPLLDPRLSSLHTIRIGTKSVAYWPYRYCSDDDATQILRLFAQVEKAGKQLAIMAHYSHPRELEPPIAVEAIRRIRETGAIIRTQAPLIRGVNDASEIWADLWRSVLNKGVIPYYMFVERNTGPKNYFEVSLDRACDIFRDAYNRVSGLARTVRGPSMSTTPGKVTIDGVAEIGGEKVFVLHFIQARDPAWVQHPFFARFDPEATWLTDLKPAFGKPRFFFEEDMDRIKQQALQRWAQYNVN